MSPDKTLDVLIIDDEVPFSDILKKRLGKRGLDVRTANSGPKGLAALEERLADVVVLDMRMPGMDGVDTFRAIKELAPDTEVIFLTGHVDTDSALAGLEMGAFDYCLKPIDLDALYDKLLDAAERKRLAEGIGSAIK
ncbi:response regulator [Oceanidesulfovibrio marinus]|uniref:Response regulator n=1 Tax=Oceanidesulfovibrio marinus TaxID=370038 RepID=A0A6P1ZF86_9BACT|nr:response regulator [Oceanidesulfovibrio marinus]QJT09631.1 response regulator [Oceanidesulfovibrio marinus]TVM30993.1 response regulator [Oceanidesulfovibrio marinus]